MASWYERRRRPPWDAWDWALLVTLLALVVLLIAHGGL